MNSAEREELLDAALREYSRAVVLSDPSRLEVWEELGLTMSQLRVLFYLNSGPSVTAGKLAERLGVPPSTVTGIVARLVRHDLVARRADPDDRRVVRNCLTARGTEVVSDISRAGRSFMTGVLDRLSSDDLTRLCQALSALTREAESMGLLAPTPRPASVAEAP